MSDEEIISTAEAARLIGISTRAVTNALRAGKIEGKLLTRQWVVSRQSALAYKIKRGRRLREQLDKLNEGNDPDSV